LRPIAKCVGEGSLEPLPQAEPVEQADAGLVERDEECPVPIEADEGDVRGVWEAFESSALMDDGGRPTGTNCALEAFAKVCEPGDAYLLSACHNSSARNTPTTSATRFGTGSQAALLEAAEELRESSTSCLTISAPMRAGRELVCANDSVATPNSRS